MALGKKKEKEEKTTKPAKPEKNAKKKGFGRKGKTPEEFEEDIEGDLPEDPKGKKVKPGKQKKSGAKLQVSDEILKLIFIMGGVIILLFSYFFGFQSISDENTLLESQITNLSQQLATLREMDANKEANLKEISRMQEESVAIISKYPADVLEEDVLFFIDRLELTETVSGLTTGFSPKQMVSSQTQDAGQTTDPAATNTQNTATPGNYVLYNTVATMNFSASYNDTKSVIDQILQNQEQRSIGQMDISFDEGTGNLNGTLTLNNYSMTGTGSEYQKTPIEEMPQGRPDLFSTVGGAGAAPTETQTVQQAP